MAEIEVRNRSRSLFLDDANHFGCAETALVALKERSRAPAAVRQPNPPRRRNVIGSRLCRPSWLSSRLPWSQSHI
jgi:hypothetical protein